jgi:hypothetical protein
VSGQSPPPRISGKISRSGSVAEWLKAPVLKTGDGQPFVSSNLTASAKTTPAASAQRTSVFAGNSLFDFSGMTPAREQRACN